MIREATSCVEPVLVSQELADFARRQYVNARLYKGEERRIEGRHMMMMPVWVVPVNSDNEATGEPIQIITRDISSRGIGLYHEAPINDDRLAIQFEIADTEVNLVIDLLWMRPMGPFYGSAGSYAEKLDQFPVDLSDR